MILCPPREIARLYPFPFSYAANPYSYAANHMSQVNVLSPDLTRFPAWAHADRALLELGPGDMPSSPSAGGMPSGALTRTCRSATGGAPAPPTSSRTPARRLPGSKKCL